MSIIDMIKDLFKKNDNLLEEWQIETLDDAVASYLGNLWKVSSQVSSSNLSYYALLKVNAHENKEKGKNDKKEEAFISKIRKNFCKYELMRYPKSVDKPTDRYIIFNKDLNINKLEQDSMRIYINLKRKNIMDFASEFVNKVGDHPFYIKFNSDKGSMKRERTDPFIVYLKNEDEEYFTEIIEKIFKKKPKLMEGTKKKNPFIATGKIDTIATAHQSENGVVLLEDNRIMRVDKSYNNIISYILEDAFRYTIQEKIGEQMDVKKKNISDLLQVFDENIGNIDTFIKTMTNKVVEGFNRNNIPIKENNFTSNLKRNFIREIHVYTPKKLNTDKTETNRQKIQRER